MRGNMVVRNSNILWPNFKQFSSRLSTKYTKFKHKEWLLLPLLHLKSCFNGLSGCRWCRNYYVVLSKIAQAANTIKNYFTFYHDFIVNI